MRERGGVLWLTTRMQVRESSVQGNRPECPVDRRHRVHSHGEYERYGEADGTTKEKIRRWLCVRCAGTISVLPDAMLPYRPVGVGLIEVWFDAVFQGRAPPMVTA